MLGHTLKNFPQAEKEIKDAVQDFHRTFNGQRFDIKFMAARFRAILKKAGVSEEDWPFSHKGLGQRAIEKYIVELVRQDFLVAASTLGRHGATHAPLGTGVVGLISPDLPFDIIQLDAYKVDKFCILRIETQPGIYTQRVLDRFWILAALEDVSNGVLAAKFVFNSEVTATDVEGVLLDAIIGDWAPYEDITIADLDYTEGGGMLGYAVPETQGIIWGTLMLDNAMAHHANKIKHKFRRNVGCSINYGQLNRPERRSTVENTFKQVATKIMHRVPSTTGSGPQQGRAATPEENAEKYEIYVDEAEMVLDVWLANYNCTPKQGANFSLSPIDILRMHFNNDKREVVFPQLPESKTNKVLLGHDVRYCVVRGSAEGGRAPHITLDKAQYTNKLLSSDLSLIGRRIVARINPKDYRFVDAILDTGESLGTLKVLGYWSKTAHSVTTRHQINRAYGDKAFELVRSDDIVLSYVDYLLLKPSKRNLLKVQEMKSEVLGRQVKTDWPNAPEAQEAEVRAGSELVESKHANRRAEIDDFFNVAPGGVIDE
jgi:putative transposase